MLAIGLPLLKLTQTNLMFNVETDSMKTPADLGIYPVLNQFQTKKSSDNLLMTQAELDRNVFKV